MRDNEFPHLRPDVIETLPWSPDKRIEFNNADRFVQYEQADKALARLERLHTSTKTIRPQNLALSGPPGIGKTSILGEFMRSHPSLPVDSHISEEDSSPNLVVTGPPGSGKTALLHEFQRRNPGRSTDDVEIKPVLKVEVTSPGEGRLLSAILKELGYYEDWDRGSIDSKLRRVLNGLQNCRVETLMLDESNHFFEGGKRTYESLRVIKTISNLLGVHIVLVGTGELCVVLTYDKQLQSRFEVIKLEPFGLNQAFIDFLYQFEASLSLAKPSCLYKEDKAPRILELSKALNPDRRPGVLFSITKLIRLASEMAITDGSEQIQQDHLKLVAEDNRYEVD